MERTLPKYSGGAGGGRRRLDGSQRSIIIVLLIAVKVCASLGVFMLGRFLHDATSAAGEAAERSRIAGTFGGILGKWGVIVQTVAFIQLTSGMVYSFVQKPLRSVNKSPIMPRNWFKIFRHSILSILLIMIWISGLMLAGPFRTVLLSCHYNYVLAGIVSGFSVGKSGPTLRGAFLFLVGLTILMLFDDTSVVAQNKPTIHIPGTVQIPKDDHSYLSKNSAGILTLTFYIGIKLAFDALSKSLAVDVGGLKRLHSLSTLISGSILYTVVFLDLLSGGSTISIWSNFFTLLFIVLFSYVMNYYVDVLCLRRLDTWQVARIGTGANLLSALVYNILWIRLDEIPGTPTLVAFFIICYGIWSLTISERASGGGTLVGFSTDGLPLFSFSSQFSGDGRSSQLWSNMTLLLSSFYKEIQEDPMSRKIFYYFLLTIVFTIVELLYGAVTNSLGLISDGFHMLFDSMAIFIGLVASVISRWKATPSYPFGYGRIEVLSGFINSFFLLVVAIAIFFEAWGRLFSPPSVDAHQSLQVSIVGLVVNLIGIYVFRNSATVEHTHLHDNANIRGVFLHVFADTLGSIGVIFSSLLIKNFNILVADPLCSLIIAALICKTAWPLLKDTGRILLLSIPPGFEKTMQHVVLQLLSAEGVKGYKSLRLWTHAPELLTGSIHIQATKDANEQQITRTINNIFLSSGFSHFTTQVEKDEFIARFNFLDNEDPAAFRSKSVTGIDLVGIGPDAVIISNEKELLSSGPSAS